MAANISVKHFKDMNLILSSNFRLVSCHDEVHIKYRQDMTPIMLASRGAGGLAAGAGGSLGQEGQKGVDSPHVQRGHGDGGSGQAVTG